MAPAAASAETVVPMVVALNLKVGKKVSKHSLILIKIKKTLICCFCTYPDSGPSTSLSSAGISTISGYERDKSAAADMDIDDDKDNDPSSAVV